jgi:hypothetical protein
VGQSGNDGWNGLWPIGSDLFPDRFDTVKVCGQYGGGAGAVGDRATYFWVDFFILLFCVGAISD